MTIGENYALRILIASDLGINSKFTKEANHIINKTKKIPPIIIGQFEKEADRCVQWIHSNDLLKEASRLALEKYSHIT